MKEYVQINFRKKKKHQIFFDDDFFFFGLISGSSWELIASNQTVRQFPDRLLEFFLWDSSMTVPNYSSRSWKFFVHRS